METSIKFEDPWSEWQDESIRKGNCKKKLKTDIIFP